jgi:predicted membrane channel-forming protein YqfA (hemolysin III family)
MNFKLKEKFDKYSTRGLVYAGIALLGIGYELIFSGEVRPFLIIMYSVVIGIGGLYVFFIEELE